MLEPVFLGLGVLNSLALIAVFVVRQRRLDLIERLGWLYLLLAIPAAYAIVLVQLEGKAVQYTIFLGIFVAFLAIEALYDWILRIPFRAHMDWCQLVPYLALYFASNYGFVAMAWEQSVVGGGVMLGLFVVQILANTLTHPRG
jgi:hypothetical protein